ncbi:ComF family protein [Sinanaerobacter sp. ZZT-01]|uniref:ComF family protein n=1 Tax=Sinanaerobacter sp. ZZT-01 TaxID=3111540 RepID=UPI002D7A28AF|nr:ComF family protein [Sinanaerobacter sp. ZZT-01]WRR94354.1 ComF family protein [Sinanaerobacter sp. ZZT-01]
MQFAKKLSEWVKMALEAVFPSNIYCICCNDFIDSKQLYALCSSCMHKLHWIVESTCPKCGKSVEEEGLCLDCSASHRWFEKGISCVQYGRLEKEVIHRFKYRDAAYIGCKLAQLMAERFEIENLSVDAIVAVPMYLKKERRRGYNQAAVLAKELSREMGIEYINGLLIRTRDTVPMSELSADERIKNVKNAFTVNQNYYNIVEYKKILLVDDVFTTGNTVNECSRVLKECGADSIYVLTFASGVGK